ncbi:sensor histidine kinase (plasmid) [Streptomyces sp. BI20]|uniref:sensor histidine kinase n=1 Tax=Streptomyces sp. BI20 TaxID=3403460 RepID=UPI003C72ACCB
MAVTERPRTPGEEGGAGGSGAGRARHGWFRVSAGEWLFAVAGLPFALLGGVYALAVGYAGALLSLTVLGLPFLVLGLSGARALGAVHRRWVGRLLGEGPADPAAPVRPVGMWARGRAVLGDAVAWRALLYLGARLPLGVLGFVAAVLLPPAGLWLVGYPVWVRLLEPGPRPVGGLDLVGVPLGIAVWACVPAAVRLFARVNRALARGLLGPIGDEGRVRALESARSVLLAENTDRLRRLERDLHDGTQARLVALAITLSLAEDALADATPGDGAGPDAGRLRTLVDRARGQTEDTITELRRLTRGIHPAALDAGLGEALPGLADGAGVPVELRLDLRERADPAIEHAVYHCAAELLTNVSRHSGARTAGLAVTVGDGRVRLTVRDDGHGGATLDPGAGGRADGVGGTGLVGLAERVAAVDGKLRVHSPPGGPTVIRVDLPARL